MRLAVSHVDKRALAFSRARWRRPAHHGPLERQGLVAAPPSPGYLKQFSFLLDKTRVPVFVAIDGVKRPIDIPHGVPADRKS